MLQSPDKTTIGSTFTVLETIDSTNNYAMQMAKSGAGRHGDVFFAREQTQGKGQRGKRFVSEPYQNVAMSALLNVSAMNVHESFPFVCIAGLAVYDFFSKYAGTETAIKWPNDIYWKDKKAVGILCESIFRGSKCQWIIVGIGVNVNQEVFPEEIKNKATSLKKITGQKYDTIDAAKAIAAALEIRWQELLKLPFETVCNEYNRHLYKKGRQVKFEIIDSGNIIDAHILRVDTQGMLHVLVNGKEESFNFGSVKWL